METKKRVPLAERMRPKNFDEFVGQTHIVGGGQLLRRAIEIGSLGSVIFYGPPGTGKTTLAHIVANLLNGRFEKLNAVSSGVADAKAVIERARQEKAMFGTQTYLLLDECHRWSKSQSDCVLEAIEDGSIIFIGSTTENPYTSMTRAIVSRCRVFEFKPVQSRDVEKALRRAIIDKENGLGDFPLVVEDDAIKHLAFVCAGDVRSALNALELAALTTPFDENQKIVITKDVAAQSIGKKALSVDETGFYDMLSAFCKSIRGSDADAALYYSQRLVLAGIDPMIIARRLVVHCSEDIGMADSNALLLATSALTAMEKIGYPEGMIPLSHAIIYACEAEKSNSVIVAMNAAKADAESSPNDAVPAHLKNHPDINHPGAKYKYPHEFGGYVKQQYLPNALKNRIYYVPSGNGREKNLIRKKLKNK